MVKVDKGIRQSHVLAIAFIQTKEPLELYAIQNHFSCFFILTLHFLTLPSIINTRPHRKVMNGPVRQQVIRNLHILRLCLLAELVLQILLQHTVNEAKHSVSAKELVFADVV